MDTGAVYKGRPPKSRILNHPSPCPGASEFLKSPLPGRPRPDFPTFIFIQLLSLAEKIKKLGQQEDKTFNPGRYTNEIQWVNCLFTGTNYRLTILVDWVKI